MTINAFVIFRGVRFLRLLGFRLQRDLDDLRDVGVLLNQVVGPALIDVDVSGFPRGLDQSNYLAVDTHNARLILDRDRKLHPLQGCGRRAECHHRLPIQLDIGLPCQGERVPCV